MAKAKNINGTVKIFDILPNSYGNIISGFADLSDSDLASWGFYNIEEDSDYNGQIHNEGELTFDSDNNVYKRSKTNKTWSETVAQLKTLRIDGLKENARIALLKTDWYVTRKSELGTEIPSDISTARASIRTSVETKTNEINALSTKASIILYDNSI